MCVPTGFVRGYRAFVTTIRQSAQTPRDLLLTILGLFGRDAKDAPSDQGPAVSRGSLPLAIATIVALMSECGIDDASTRSAVSRLKRRGVVEPVQIGSAAAYALTAPLLAVFDEGDRRIFRAASTGGTTASADTVEHTGRWLLVVFSVPEAERRRRHVLRSRLSSLGFGTVAPGVWIAPGTVEHELRVVLDREGLGRFVTMFRVDPALVSGVDDISRWWDLETLDAAYRTFVASQRPVLDGWRRRRSSPGGPACADYVRAVSEWRRLPYLDPGLPTDALPRGWHGSEARRVFEALDARLAEAAHRHVDDLQSASFSSPSRG